MEVSISPSFKCLGIDEGIILGLQETCRLEEKGQVRISMIYEYVGKSVGSVIIGQINNLPDCITDIKAVARDYGTFLDALLNRYKTVAGALEIVSMERSRNLLTREMQTRVDQYLSSASTDNQLP